MLLQILFPLLLLLWPMAAVGQGIDLADVTYSLANFRYLGRDGAGSTWFFATYLANRVGGFFDGLGGNSLLVMEILCSLFICGAALACYFYFVKAEKKPAWIVFLALFLAESLFWLPSVVLYNTLTYFFLALAMLSLYGGVRALGEAKEKKAQILFLLAGVCLGMNGMVRISNFAQCALILALWYYEVLTNRSFAAALRHTFCCIGGFVLGFALVLLDLAIHYGPAAYFTMIPAILSMGSSASDYTMLSMVKDTINAYINAGKYFAFILVFAVCLGVLFYAAQRIVPNLAAADHGGRNGEPARGRSTAPRHAGLFRGALAVISLLLYGVLVRFLYGRGMFNFIYADYWCMFRWAMVLLLIMLPVMAAALFMKTVRPEEKFAHAAGILVILITPLGSNNYTFPVLLALFPVLPVFLNFVFERIVPVLRHFLGIEPLAEGAGRKAAPFLEAAAGVFLMVLATTLLQAGLFHVNFAFGDGTDGTRRTETVESIPYLAGVHTTPATAAAVTSLYEAVEELTAEGVLPESASLITMGNAPGLHLLFAMEPALSNLWTDLDSYAVEEFTADLRESGLPVIIDRKGTAEGVNGPVKREILAGYLADRGYGQVYDGEAFTIWYTVDKTFGE